MTDRLKSKVAIITGGVRGIGEAITRIFIEEGANVVVADINPRGAELVDTYGSDRLAFKITDVTREQDLEDLIRFTVERFGKLDIMVNNAGALGDQTSLVDLDADGFERTNTLLLRSAALGHKYAARQMIKQGAGGSIVTTSSIAGIEGGWSAASYDTAKAGLIQLARSATYELAPHGIRSNVVAPGLILTPIIATACDIAPEHYDKFIAFLEKPYGSVIPLRQAGKPEDIAEAILYFSSDFSRHVTGQCLAVDGGLTSITGFNIGAVIEETLNAFNEHLGKSESTNVGWLPTRHN